MAESFGDRLTKIQEALSEFVENNFLVLLAAIGIFIVVMGLFFSVKWYFKHREEKAFELLLKAEVMKNGTKEIEKLFKDYPSTSAGKMAGLFLINFYYSRENYTALKGILKELKDVYPDNLKALPLYGEGKVYEELSEKDKAFKVYKNDLGKLTFLDEYLYFDLARLSEENGDKKRALKFYKTLKNNFPETIFKPLVEYKIWRLGR